MPIAHYSLDMQLTSIFFVCFFSISHEESAELSSRVSDSCPLWTEWNSKTQQCECGNDLRGVIVHCDSQHGATQLKLCFCMTPDPESKGSRSLRIGECFYSCIHLNDTAEGHNSYNKFYSNIANSTISTITHDTCGSYNRKGMMCSHCIRVHGLPVYSYRVACVKCSNYKHNWLKYIAVAYIPLTVFCCIVMVFRISATSGEFMGYVTVCQIISVPQIQVLWSIVRRSPQVRYTDFLNAYFSIWNLDFFRVMYEPFCLHPKLSTLQVLALDYGTALYPMVLVLLMYMFVKLHDRYHILVWICNPCYKCFHLFRKEWEIKNSLIATFATFYLLSYVKILNISGSILTFTYLYSMEGMLKAIPQCFDGVFWCGPPSICSRSGCSAAPFQRVSSNSPVGVPVQLLPQVHEQDAMAVPCPPHLHGRHVGLL